MVTRILLADDHELVRDTIAMFIQAEGDYEVTSVSSVDAAMEEVGKNGAFDLVLLDYNMPGMNGLDGMHKIIR